MPITYSEILTYWSNNLCSGGWEDFPYNLYKNLKVLEIGCGAGRDAKRFVAAKAIYTGIDLTQTAVEFGKTQVGVYGCIYLMNAEKLDFPDDYFDLVYSFGVIHHTMNPEKVVSEIYRVLKPSGKVVAMVYNKPSIRYNLDIMFLRKILWYIHYWRYNKIRQTMPHPAKSEWISINTDNLGCPLSRVYSKKEAENLFNQFENVKSFTKEFGWFRIIIGKK